MKQDRRPSNVTCDVTWTKPVQRKEILSASIPRMSCIYAITLREEASRSMLRVGATSSIRQRISGYKILNLIPGAEVSYWPVSDAFSKLIEPYATDYFTDPNVIRPKHLRGKPIEYCLARELGKAEYKAELILLEEYRRRHGHLPPGNARAGSKRTYIPGMRVIEHGDWQLLDLPCAELPSEVSVSGHDLMQLLW